MRLIELQCKDVINIETGCKIGFVCDIEIRIPECARICAIIVEKKGIFNYFKIF